MYNVHAITGGVAGPEAVITDHWHRYDPGNMNCYCCFYKVSFILVGIIQVNADQANHNTKSARYNVLFCVRLIWQTH